MVNRVLFLLLVSLSMVSDALAEMKRLAVLEYRGVGVDQAYLLNLSDQSRRAAVEILSSEEYLIITRENMMQYLDDMGKDASCMEGMCEVEVGRNIGADTIITGDVLQIENTYVLTLKLYDTMSGGLLSTVDIEATDLLSLKRDAYNQSVSLIQQGLQPTTGAIPQNTGFQGTVKSEDWFVEQGQAVLVDFDSNPSGAVVLVDGQMLCTETPCRKEMSKKSHQIVFQKERYFPYQMTVDVGQERNVEAALEPNFGTVTITGVDGVRLNLDGKFIGETPIQDFPVDPGLRTITVEDPCYVGPEYRFQSKAGELELVKEYPLEARESAISVHAKDLEGNPVPAKVKLDGQYLGETPLVQRVPLCSKDLKVSFEGFVQHRELNLEEHKQFDLDLVMGTAVPRICDVHPEILEGVATLGGVVSELGGITALLFIAANVGSGQPAMDSDGVKTGVIMFGAGAIPAIPYAYAYFLCDSYKK